MNIKENDQIPNVDIFVMENREPVGVFDRQL